MCSHKINVDDVKDSDEQVVNWIRLVYKGTLKKLNVKSYKSNVALCSIDPFVSRHLNRIRTIPFLTRT